MFSNLYRLSVLCVSYPEIFKVNVTDRTCTVSDFDMKCRNIYTKTEVDALIAGGGGVLDDIKAKKVYISAPDELYYYTLSCEGNTLRLISERDLIATFNNNSLTYFANTEKPFSITREAGYDKIATTNNALEISCNTIAITGNESTCRVVLAAKDIIFNGK